MPREALIAQLKRHEGVRLKPYRCPAGRLTLGVGRNLDDCGITLAGVRRGDYAAAARSMLVSKWARQVGARARELAEQMRTGRYAA